MYTRGSSTWSWTTTRFSEVMGGVVARIFGTSGPRASGPKYFSTIALVFALSVISIPLLMERDIDVVTAMAASVRAVVSNPKAMGLWAALIAGAVFVGIATLGAGLVVVFPLIGHATWHAYRDVIVDQ